MTREIDETERQMIRACDAALDKLEAEFHAYLLTFLSELDIQRRYLAMLESEFKKRNLSGVLTNASGERIAIVHQDYGSAQGQGHRTDVVILRPRELHLSKGSGMRIDNRYSQPLVALEFGTEKSEQRRSDGRGVDLCAHTERDLQKLKATNAVERRLVICYRSHADLSRRRDHRGVLEEKMRRLRNCVRTMRLQHPETEVRLVIERLR